MPSRSATRNLGRSPRGAASMPFSESGEVRPRLDEGELALEDFRGRQVLLVFSDPGCGPCQELAPKLNAMYSDNPDIQVITISRGDREANRLKAAEQRLKFPIVLQRQWEISRLYGMFGTPIGYLIDEQGIISADVAVGMEPIVALLSGAATRAKAISASSRRRLHGN